MIEVELDDQILEFPDEMTQDEIRSVLREKFPAPRTTPIVEPPSTLRTPSLQTPFTAQEFSLADPEYGGALGRMAAGEAPADARHRGIAGAVGVTPEMVVPSGRTIAESPVARFGLQSALAGVSGPVVSRIAAPLIDKALLPTATVGASVAKTGLGVADYLSSPQGITEFVGSMSPAKLIVLGKWAYDMSKGAYTEASELGKMLAKENKTPDDWQKISDHTVNALAMAFGTRAVAKHGAGEIKSIAEKLNMPEGKFQVEDRGDVAQGIFNEFEARRQAEAGSPFVRLEPPASTVTMGIQTQPQLGAAPTFQPSGLRLAAPTVETPTTGIIQPPAPSFAPPAAPGRATQRVRLQGEAAQRAADFEKALADKVSQEQKEPFHPDKALTENQLRIIQQSLAREILEGQIGRENRPGVISGSALEKWADGVLSDKAAVERMKRSNMLGIDEYAKVVGALVVKGGALLERGIVDVAQWTAAMVKEFGEGIRPFLNDIRSQAEQLRSSTERKGQDAIQQEATGAVRDVRQQQVAPQGEGQVPVTEGRPQAAETRVMWSSSSPKEGMFLSDKVADAEAYALGRESKQYEVTINNPFDPSTSKDAALVRQFDKLGGIHEAPQNKSFRDALKKKGYDGIIGGERGFEGESNWAIPLDKSQVKEVKAAETRVAPTIESDKALYKQITDRMTELVRGGDVNSPILEVLKSELEVVKNRHGGMPPGQTSPARQTMATGIADELQPAVKIGGKIIRSQDTGHIQMARDSGHPDWVSEVSKPENQGFWYKGEFHSRAETSELLGEKTPMTTERLREIRKENATKTLEQRLEDLKFSKQGLAGKLYTLNPRILERVGKSIWNDAIDLAIFTVRSGKSAAAAIEAALDHIRKNRSGIDEAPLRAELERVLQLTIPTTVYPTEGETVAMRKSAERATTSEMIPEPVQERIKTAPESQYTQQSMKRVEETVSAMSDTELSTVPRDSNLYTAAKLEQANRLFKAGQNDAGYDVFVELEKEGTRLGQLINQFKLLKGTRPEDIVRVINTTLRKEGKDPLNKTQEQTGLETSRKSKDADRTLDEATTEWEKNPTPENAAKAEKALLESNAAALELQRFVGKFQPRSLASILKSILQGGLLTPISQTANIVGNMMNVPFRAGSRTVATSLDILDNFLTGRPREISVSPIRGTVEAAKGLGRGAAQIPDVLLRGSGDTIKGETRAGLHPIQAWINQFSKNPDIPTTGGRLTLQDRLNLAIEGTFGVPAEAMLRGLSAGDVPFREAARARAVNAELDLAKVPREQRGFAQKFPELFLDEVALKRIHDSTLQAIFQQPSKLLNIMTGWLRGKGEWLDLLAATIAPYKLTPWNIIGEILSYNPLVAMAKTVNEARVGNRRQAKINAGKMVVGTALTAAGWWLYKNQLMSPSLDQRDEQQKARILAGEVMPPNHINISGLRRAMDKMAKGEKPTPEDTNFRKGDETRDVFRAGGLAGSMFYMTANIGRQFERSPEVPESEAWGALLRQSTLEQARFGMNQSFLQGVEGLLSAVREGNVDSYIQRWGNTVASIPLPNSLTVMSRASREYKPDLREDTFKQQMENIVRNRLGIAGLDDYLPLKRGLWGEPMKETPEGRNAIMYHFFDVFKGKQVTSDPVPLELYRLWRKTTDTRVIPSLPEKVLTVGGQQYPLTAAQQSRYAELVGQTRRKIVDAIVVNPEFHKLPDEKKIDLLDRVYRAGQQGGKAQFWQESGAALTPKPSRAGFQQPVMQP